MLFRVRNGEPRTNNYIEGWHRGMERQLQDVGKGPHDFVEVLQNNCVDSIQKFYSSNTNNTEPPKKRTKQVVRDQKIKDLVHEFDKKSPLDYLDSLAPYMKQN